MKSSTSKQIPANSSKSPPATVSAVRFRPQPVPRKSRGSVGKRVGKRWFFVRWPDRVWEKNLALARQMVRDVRERIAGSEKREGG